MLRGTREWTKLEIANHLLRTGKAHVHLDPRVKGVLVPSWFRYQPHLALLFALDTPLPVLDLEVTDEGISGVLTFNGAPYICAIPWRAVYGLIGDDDIDIFLWPEDAPTEIADQLPMPADVKSEAVEPPQLKSVPTKAKPRRRGKGSTNLHIVK